MTVTSPEPFRIPGYDFAAPTEREATASLARVFGAERGAAVWSKACADAGVAEGRVTSDDIGRVADALAREGGACAAVGRSIHIRMRTHQRLAAKRAELQPRGMA
ncbi:MAG: hypothetical protein H0X64_07450 [Gemmatimonadaceae bacterium]|nr:hypothetical protein [Gemmatimonadaceae bacterium]